MTMGIGDMCWTELNIWTPARATNAVLGCWLIIPLMDMLGACIYSQAKKAQAHACNKLHTYKRTP